MTYKNEIPFQTIKNAATTTGLSQHYLRAGVKAGTVPHVKSGRCIKINVPALLRQLGVTVEGECD